MIRERLVRAVLRAYPRPERESLGPEIESTVLDAGPTPRWTFARELLDLARYGLNRRASSIASAGTGRVIADGVCNGATWIMILDLATMSVWWSKGAEHELAAGWSICALALVLATSLYGFDRIAGVGALIWAIARMPALAGATTPVRWVPPTVLVVGLFLTLVLFPRDRAQDVRRLGWLAVPFWLAATLKIGRGNGGFVLIELLVVVAVVVTAALAGLPTDPRLAIAAALPVTYVGLGIAHRGTPGAAVFVAAAPIVVGLAVLRSRRLRWARIAL